RCLGLSAAGPGGGRLLLRQPARQRAAVPLAGAEQSAAHRRGLPRVRSDGPPVFGPVVERSPRSRRRVERLASGSDAGLSRSGRGNGQRRLRRAAVWRCRCSAATRLSTAAALCAAAAERAAPARAAATAAADATDLLLSRRKRRADRGCDLPVFSPELRKG